ncbi:MAG: hypothetical protein D6719_13260 [Candidatus Dadabacteria bacterium]|nr:MAG: hypothetical protein D6719_13260 [Candidatus Dadabacteria bacterium]
MKILKRNLIAIVILATGVLSNSLYAEYKDQPDTYSSSLTTNSGQPVYDWQLANMFKMWIANKGFANSMFVFNQCFGGGMIDDIVSKLGNNPGDVALISASRHNETSWGINDGYSAPANSKWGKRGYTTAEDFFAKEIGEEIAKTGASAETAADMFKKAAKEDPYRNGLLARKEHPQGKFLGSGANMKLGKKTDGSSLSSKHAILFMGKPNGQRHWGDLDRIHKALLAQGYTESDMVILAGDGQKKWNGSNAPSYVDGKGTKKALFDAIKSVSSQMNSNEQFFFWVSDHGNRERTETALNKAITDTVKQDIPPTTGSRDRHNRWLIDRPLLKLSRKRDADRFLSLIVDTSFPIDFFESLQMFLNGRQLNFRTLGQIEAYDADPDLDGYELIYDIPRRGRGKLKRKNRVEIAWGGDPSTFQKFTILALQLGVSITTQPTKLKKRRGRRKR